MKIGIFGMGYVGTTSAAALLQQGHEIIGVDSVEAKVKNLSEGKSPMISEPGVEDLLLEGHRSGLLKSTIDVNEGIIGSDMIWICVGTPSTVDGGVDFSFVDAVIKSIGESLRHLKDRPLIVVRSTCLPGTMRERIKPLLEKSSGLIVDQDIDLVFHPEFLREGTALDDFKNPPKIVVGESRSCASEKLLSIYKDYNVVHFRLKFEEAEMVKYCDNLFHALKVTFANEVAMISNSVGVDSRVVSKVYCADTKLNISSRYLYPGFAYGGSCLPKDLRAILRFAALNSLHIPMLNGIAKSNNSQIESLVSRILDYKPNRVGMVGISFKTNTDDTRESPYMKVAKLLMGEGIEIIIYDKFVREHCLVGSNKDYFQKVLRNTKDFFVSSLDDLCSSDLIVINHAIAPSKKVKEWCGKGIRVIDLVDVKGVDRSLDFYEGIYW